MQTQAELENRAAHPTVSTVEVDKGDAVSPAEAAPAPGTGRPVAEAEVELDRRIDAALEGAEVIIFYDGVCGLCDHFIQFMMARDKKRIFRYGQQQGETFARVAELFPELSDLSTVVLAERVGPAPRDGGQDWRHGWRYSKYSTASLRAVRRLGGAWPVTSVFLLVPPFLRHAVYKLIAKNRYRMFGKVDACRLPTKEERALFLP